MISTQTAKKKAIMYILFNVESTKIVGTFKTEGAAKGAATKLAKAGKLTIEDHCVLPTSEFRALEKTETVYNLMSGHPVVQSVNTPLCCDPSSETYWSM
jgi:hypothetical protein